eukprot:GHVQ01025411.1.p1 GENE.GHVQ01025411.1~~GHVQ01025411.1.p1  ORF type:complete len:222 (+),score=46.36 GHVQ01025411.1:449-1114(+)
MSTHPPKSKTFLPNLTPPLYNPYAPPLLPPHLCVSSSLSSSPSSAADAHTSLSSGSAQNYSGGKKASPPVFCQRWAWTGFTETLKHQAGSLYNSFFYTKANVKYAMIFAFPAFLWYTRWRADSRLGYYMFIEDESIYPDYSKHRLLFNTKWENGKKMYLEDSVTVRDVKDMIYEGRKNVPEDVAVGCHGRMMEDDDNLALAVRAFCKRDPKILLFKDNINS